MSSLAAIPCLQEPMGCVLDDATNSTECCDGCMLVRIRSQARAAAFEECARIAETYGKEQLAKLTEVALIPEIKHRVDAADTITAAIRRAGKGEKVGDGS